MRISVNRSLLQLGDKRASDPKASADLVLVVPVRHSRSHEARRWKRRRCYRQASQHVISYYLYPGCLTVSPGPELSPIPHAEFTIVVRPDPVVFSPP